MGYSNLTPKELEALALIAQGHDAKSAACRLSVSVHTVYERLRRAREKLGAANSREAARIYFGRSGLEADENFVGERLVLSDAYRADAWSSSPGVATEEIDGSRFGEGRVAHASQKGSRLRLFLPLRAPGEDIVRVNKVDRLRLIGELSTRLAMAFVAICLAAMTLSTLLERG